MLHIDTLSGYTICSVGSLLGAAMLRMAEGDDPQVRRGLRTYGWGLVLLGLAVLPTGLGLAVVAQAWAQLSITAGTLAAVTVVAQGLGTLVGRPLPGGLAALAAGLSVLGCALSQPFGALALGRGFAVGLGAVGTLCAWITWRFTLRARDFTERAIGLAMLAVALSGWLRAGMTLAYAGPPRPDLLYVPPSLVGVFALLYGVLPLIVTSLVLNLVNSRLRQQLRLRAGTDELTATMSRRALRELAPAVIAAEKARQRELAVLMLDLDHFKLINDRLGHATGDAVLVQAARLFRAQLRQDSLLARYGGEEFVALLPVHDVPEARRAAERLRQAIEQHLWDPGPTRGGVTVSIGLALVGSGEDFDAALRRADLALYRAKHGGRNQCQVDLQAA